MANDLMALSACELAARMRGKDISPVEVVRAALARINAQPEINAFITVTAEQALEDARRAENRLLHAGDDPLPPLFGLPFSVKDLIWTAGVKTTMGSRLFEQFIPAEDAVAVARAKAAGAILIGKTTTPEFGHKQEPTAPLFGRTFNPINPRFTPGASSSGAAAAVAAGMGPLALGTDGGGSIRIPAACCAVVGLKASPGVIPHLQAPDMFAVNSYTGPMARNVADTALLFHAIAGFDPRDPHGQGEDIARRADDFCLNGLRVAWLLSAGNPVDAEVAACTTAVVRSLERQGAHVETVELDFVSLEQHFLVILESTLAARLGDQLALHEDRIDPTLVQTIKRGQTHTASALHAANFAKTQCFGALQRVFASHDVLISPTLSAPPLSVDVNTQDSLVIAGQDAGTVRRAWYPYTYPMNLTGHPALSLPCGVSAQGLPIGLQLVGPWYGEARLLALAQALETLCAATPAVGVDDMADVGFTRNHGRRLVDERA